MNLLRHYLASKQPIKNEIVNDENEDEGIFIEDFKEFQYSQLNKLIELMIYYVSCQHNNYLNLVSLDINDRPTYFGINNSELLEVTVQVQKVNSNEKSLFFKIFVPKLIEKNYFLLNGHYYVPTMYILDKPISIKKNSIKLYGLFNSITIYSKQSTVTFIGANIPINHFMQLFLTESEDIKLLNNFLDKHKINKTTITESNLINYYSSKFNCKKTKQDVLAFFNNIFLDDYTQYLYRYCYGYENTDMVQILRTTLKYDLEENYPSFIDLSAKRVFFIEMILNPLLDHIAKIAYRSAKQLSFDDKIKIDQDCIQKHFLKELHSKFLYDTINLYSSILSHKISFVNPGSKNPPSIISQLHETHYGRICPVSVSSQKPGETISIVPGTLVDAFGHFINC